MTPRFESLRLPLRAVLPFLAAILLAAILFFVGQSAARAAPPVSSVADKIICQCGCSAVLSQCPHQECGWGVPAKQFIAEQLDKGKTSEELMQYYVSQYGEKILAAPTKKGFNLAAWLTPFVALIVGAVAVYFLVTTWAKKRRITGGAEAAVPTGPVGDLPEELSRRLEDELKNFD